MLNDQQTLFVVLYGIYFAITVGTSGRFHPFDSSAVIAFDKRAIFRFVVGFVLLNILPLLYFLFALLMLKEVKVPLTELWSVSFCVLLASLGGFGLYRIFTSIMLVRRRTGHFLFYSTAEESRTALRKYAEHRQPPCDAQDIHPGYVFVGGLIWTVCSVLALFAIKWVLLPPQ